MSEIYCAIYENIVCIIWKHLQYFLFDGIDKSYIVSNDMGNKFKPHFWKMICEFTYWINRNPHLLNPFEEIDLKHL